jgi:hypothetical protein
MEPSLTGLVSASGAGQGSSPLSVGKGIQEGIRPTGSGVGLVIIAALGSGVGVLAGLVSGGALRSGLVSPVGGFLESIMDRADRVVAGVFTGVLGLSRVEEGTPSAADSPPPFAVDRGAE